MAQPLSSADIRVSWVPGTFADPGTENAFEVFNPDMNPHKAVIDDFAAEAGFSYIAPPKVAGRFTEFGFGTYIVGSDTADVPTILGRPLQACGLTEGAVDSDPKIAYTYTSEYPIAVVRTDLRYYAGGLEWIMLNNVGNFVIDAPAGQTPTIVFNFRGNVDPSNPVEAAQGSPKVFTTEVATYPVQGNTFTINPGGAGAVAVDCLQWGYSSGNSLYGNPDVGGDFGFDPPTIQSRRGGFATMRIHVVDLAVFNPTELFNNQTELVVATQLEGDKTGADADGHIITTGFGGKIRTKPQYTKNEDAMIFEIELGITNGNGISLGWQEI